MINGEVQNPQQVRIITSNVDQVLSSDCTDVGGALGEWDSPYTHSTFHRTWSYAFSRTTKCNSYYIPLRG